MPRMLHLRAEDEADLPALSALVQDFVVRAGDIGFDRRARRLLLLGNRFCWEARTPARARTALLLSSLLKLERRTWPASPAATLELLAIEAEPAGSDWTLTLAFAGGPALRATAECIDVLLDDLAPPWPTPRVPGHGG
mgnify:CR=1 FL=1